MPRHAPSRSIQPRRRLNKDDLLADSFLDTFGEHFKTYRDNARRERLLAGIKPDARYGKMRVRDAIIFILALSAAREWQGSLLRKGRYKTARLLSKFNNSPPWYMPSDVRQAQHLHRYRERNRIEALAALGFARSAGYPTHTFALWQCVKRAIRTDGGTQRVAYLFKLIRGRLNYLYARDGKPAVQDEADRVFSLLSQRLQKAAMAGAALYALLHAKHREV